MSILFSNHSIHFCNQRFNFNPTSKADSLMMFNFWDGCNAMVSFENFYKQQLYAGRTGDLICLTQPYCLLTSYPRGTSHSSPYDYDSHVPLVLYQKGRFEKKKINSKVWIPQLPVTLAHILNCERPSASTYKLLPGIAH